jgi:hypothetical protein
MFLKRTKDDLTTEAVNVLLDIKEKITDTSDLVWTSYETAKELRDDIDKMIRELKEGKSGVIDETYSHFLPTSTFQEHAMSNGWTDEYMRLAEQFDKIYKDFKDSDR